MDAPDVTVVIPTRDRPRLVLRAVACALAQVGVAVEVVVVDDGSTAVVTEHPDARVRVLRNDASLGPAAARNRGIDAAAAPWTAFLDDDDLWVPEKLVRQLAAARDQPPAAWVGCAATLVDDRLRPLMAWELPPAGDVEDLFLARNRLMAGGSVALVRTDLLREVDGFATDLRNFEDWDLWIRLAQRSPLAVVPDVLVAYARSAGGVSHDARELETAFGRVTARWADRRLTRGVTSDDRTGGYLAEMAWRAGHRAHAARLFLDEGIEQRDWRTARRAGLALVPGSIRLKDLRARRRCRT